MLEVNLPLIPTPPLTVKEPLLVLVDSTIAGGDIFKFPLCI